MASAASGEAGGAFNLSFVSDVDDTDFSLQPFPKSGEIDGKVESAESAFAEQVAWGNAIG